MKSEPLNLRSLCTLRVLFYLFIIPGVHDSIWGELFAQDLSANHYFKRMNLSPASIS
jgi:hypothetical protein